MNYCDLHCDTPLEVYLRGVSLNDTGLNVSADKYAVFDKYVQLAAFCPPEDISDDEGYELFFKVAENFKTEVSKVCGTVCTDAEEIECSVKNGIPAFVLTAEDARILGGDIKRLYALREAGVRVLTPLWGGITCIGGSHTSDEGLTSFGKDVIKECFQAGIIPDVSHASRKSTCEIIDMAIAAGKAVIASHSCSYSINPHTRNLTDEEFLGIVETGGIVGVNLYPPHLKGTEADVSDVLDHIRHFISLTGSSQVALGCDFDGMGIFAKDGEDIGCIPHLAKLFDDAFGKDISDKILFTNAYAFLQRHIK